MDAMMVPMTGGGSLSIGDAGRRKLCCGPCGPVGMGGSWLGAFCACANGALRGLPLAMQVPLPRDVAIVVAVLLRS
jgi:hypothetical protein